MANDTNFNMRIKSDLYNRIKYIAWHNREAVAQIVNRSFEEEVHQFEKEHGKITDKQLKDARIIE